VSRSAEAISDGEDINATDKSSLQAGAKSMLDH